ncbi:tripartite motif-containing protein 29-like [Mya arenaria]|uniref:tripartite motif-containing protein 29-like n=1 Tax=Mya arenaria TaxID=6604 RepID=UPI0022E1653E|nr:tripartite motif-containing protein 29-like [Mya arenaria]
MAECGVNKVLTETEDAVAGRLQQYCKPCYKDKKTTPASVYCKSCKEFQCRECSSHHKRYDFMSDHDIVAKDQADSEDCDLSMYGCDTCSVHGSSVQIYCEDHDVLICTKCAFYDHKKCENAKHTDEFPLDKKIEQFRKSLTVCYDKAEEFINDVNEIGVKEKGEVKARLRELNQSFARRLMIL